MADGGVSHVPGFRDPTARAFLSEKGLRSLANTLKALETGKGLGLAMARVMADLIALRTCAIDAAVRQSVASGARQLVILGAGYDGRAWRMAELAGVRLFEVDRPITQQDKQSRAKALPPAMGDVTFVATDFEGESLATALDRAGHDPALPTCWIWEGVVMYLTYAAMRATLAHVAGRSAPGSTLIVNYHNAHRRWLARLIFRLVGEPQISAWSPGEMGADLRAAGFTPREDTGMADWNARFAGGTATARRGWYMRIAVADIAR